MKKPYIGVTDFVTRAQVEQAKAAITTPERRLHVGAMTSFKVLNGIKTNTGWENIWLNEHRLNKLFVKDNSVYNVIHYADYDHTDTQPAPTEVADLVKAIDISGPNVHAIQLDMVWPEISLIDGMVHKRGGTEIILQVSDRAIAELAPTGKTLEQAIRPYLRYVQYYLLDSGMGRGTQFNVEVAFDRISRLIDAGVPEHWIAVAGGLGPDTYLTMKPLLDKYPHLSCDAQGRLRPSHNAADPLDMELVTKYLNGVSSLIR